MPENTQLAHIIGFPADHSHFIQGYLYSCEAEGKTRATLESYRESLARFLKAVESLSLPRRPKLLTRDHVRRYMAHLRSQGSSAITINGRFKVLRLWLRWLIAEGVIETDPTDGIRKLKEERKVLATIRPEQVEDLLRVCQQHGRNGGREAKRKAERDRAIILLLYNSGLRASELVGLDLSDVDFDRMLLHVRNGKGRKQRMVLLGKAARQALWRYVTHARGSAPGSLFKSKRGDRLLRTSLTQLLAKLAKRTDWPDKRCGPHMFRRGFAVEFLRAGGDPFRLQLLLGHEKLDMTRLYSQALSLEDAVGAHAEFSPADRLRI